MMNDKDLAAFHDFFKGREDTYAMQNATGDYCRVPRKLITGTLRTHLKGTITVGVYLIHPETDTVNFAVIDHDERDVGHFRELLWACKKVGLETSELLLEDSGNKGRHIFFRFEAPVDAGKARRFCETIVALSEIREKVEVFPKQAKVEKGRFGNLVKLPLGIHRQSNRRSSFLDPETLEPTDGIDLSAIRRIPESKIDEILANFEVSGKDSSPTATEEAPTPIFPLDEALPCIDALLASGTDKGTRDKALFNLCIYFKGKNVPRAKAVQILTEWDKKNRPPIQSEQQDLIRQKVDHVYEREYSHVSCRELRPFCRPGCPRAQAGATKKRAAAKPRFISFIHVPNEFTAEMTFSKERGARFVCLRPKDGTVEHVERLVHRGIEIVPFRDDQIVGKAILLPEDAREYGSEAELIGETQGFIHAYLDLDPVLERLSAYYVLFTYVADGFDVCPYLRFHGDYGSGKSRALLTIGSLCYKATICSGATTASPIFRLVDKYHGTLVIDEADFERSDATEEIIKILNQGYMRGAVVLRSQEVARQHEPVAFDVYGPKILATRGAWKDKALESRCLTIVMRGRNREDIPLNVDMERFQQQALEIRNKLTLYRLRNYGKQKIDESMRVSDAEDRINQILLPLASVVQDPLLRAEYPRLVSKLQRQLLSDRTLSLECDIAEAIVGMAARGTLSIKDISEEVNSHLDEKDAVSPTVVGKIIKNRFCLTTTHARKGNFIEVLGDDVRYLMKKYGLDDVGDEQVKV